MTEESVYRRKIRSFVMRTGRMTPGQQRALDELWTVYGLEAGQPADPEQIFGRTAPLTVEIGFGMGDSLLEMALAAPERDFIGIEVHLPGVGRLLGRLAEHGVTNVRVYREDAVEVLADCIPDSCIDRLQLFFPDPWHKKKHHKRRIVQPEFVRALAAKLRPGGHFHMATDWEPYAEHMQEVMQATTELFSPVGTEKGLCERPPYRPETKFERRGARLGHGVWDIIYSRN